MSCWVSHSDFPHAPQTGAGVGRSSAAGRENHEFDPSRSKTFATCSITSAASRSFRQPTQRKAGMGTPHTRWRERHQSGRASIMPRMRFLPHEGIHCVVSISRSASWRSDFASSASPRRANHCSVARKMMGFLQRQHTGYWWRSVSPGLFSRSPRSASSLTISGFASKTFMPTNFLARGEIESSSFPVASTGA